MMNQGNEKKKKKKKKKDDDDDDGSGDISREKIGVVNVIRMMHHDMVPGVGKMNRTIYSRNRVYGAKHCT